MQIPLAKLVLTKQRRTNDAQQARSTEAQLHDSIVRQLYRRSGATGQIQLPAVPGLIDEYVTICDTLFAGVGRKFTAEELAHLQSCSRVSSPRRTRLRRVR